MRSVSLAAWCLLLVAPVLAGASEAVPDTDGTPVHLATADGLAVRGTYWAAAGEGGPAVVLLHMYGSERSAWRPLVEPLRQRRVAVLAIDMRGHGESRVQNGVDLGPMVEQRSPRLFTSMHDDVLAAVTWLATEAGRDPKRIGLVGASVGCSVALHAAALHPEQVAAVLCLSPGRKYLGVDSLAHAADLAAGLPLMLVAHKDETEGAEEIADVVRAARHEVEGAAPVAVRVLEDEYPAGMGRDRSFFHGTETFGRVPLIEAWVAGWMARALGALPDEALLDGQVAVELEEGGAWERAGAVLSPEGATLRAYRVGPRLVFGGRTPSGAESIELGVDGRVGGARALALRIRLAPAPDELVPDGPGVLGVMTAGSMLPGDLAWTEPPVRVVFVRRGPFLSFEGEALLPFPAEGEPTLRLAWGLPAGDGLTCAPGVDLEDPATFSEVPGR
jgi:pimeloyl-ACP methyl ester carboxylesterase